MSIKLFIAVVLGKTISYLTKLLKFGGGSAAPGYYALKIKPDLLTSLSQQISQTVIITGTNGKTTTNRILTHFAKASGLKVIRNYTGSNLEQGIASALIRGVYLTHPRGGLDRHLGIWELDEAAFSTVAPKLKPHIVVFLNVFRDQLDRYGEVDSIVKKWGETISRLSKKTIIFLNGDDQNLLELKKHFRGEIKTFGLEKFKINGERNLLDSQKKPDFEAKNIQLKGLVGSDFDLETKNENWKISLSIPGVYHIYDFLAAFAVAEYLKLQSKAIINSFINFSPAFGRVEKFNLPNNHQGVIFLIKNPTGTNQILEIIKQEIKSNDCLLLALNDNFADGTDVSWIWDVNFEEFQDLSRAKSRNLKVICSGKRAYDFALRLKYADFNPENLIIIESLDKAFKNALKDLDGRLFILPTYTCLLSLQKILVKNKFKKEYWREEE